MTLVYVGASQGGPVLIGDGGGIELLVGTQGPAGGNGWSPDFALINDLERRVWQLSGWVGGSGVAPPVGRYVGAAGLVDDIADASDARGGQGQKGWSPLYLGETVGAKTALKVYDWVGGEGAKPTTGQYIGPAGLVSTFASATNFQGGAGPAGRDGWTPIEATINDGARSVRRIVDWFGGTGAKPDIGMYVGATGFVAAIADAANIRGEDGPPGPGSGDVNGPAISIDGELAAFDGTDGKKLKAADISALGLATSAFVYFMRI